MRTPNFVTLAQLDREHFIACCRHGLIHFTWGRVTVRFRQDEFRSLVAVVASAMSASPPASFANGSLRATARSDEECELQMGALVLLLPSEELHRLSDMAEEASHRLDGFVSSGGWQADEDEPQPSLLEQLRKTLFSAN